MCALPATLQLVFCPDPHPRRLVLGKPVGLRQGGAVEEVRGGGSPRLHSEGVGAIAMAAQQNKYWYPRPVPALRSLLILSACSCMRPVTPCYAYACSCCCSSSSHSSSRSSHMCQLPFNAAMPLTQVCTPQCNTANNTSTHDQYATPPSRAHATSEQASWSRR